MGYVKLLTEFVGIWAFLATVYFAVNIACILNDSCYATMVMQ
jgi:hypothetical protein